MKNYSFTSKERFKRLTRRILSAFNLKKSPLMYKTIKGKSFERFAGQYEMENCFQGFQTLVLRKKL